MPIEVRCPSCNTAYRVPDDRAGAVLTCKRCNQRFQVASEPPAEAPPQPRAPQPEAFPQIQTGAPPSAGYYPPPAYSYARPRRQSQGFAGFLRGMAWVGLIGCLTGALVGLVALIVDLAEGASPSVGEVLQRLLATVVLPGVVAVVGFLCSRGGLRWLRQWRATVYDATLPRLLALASLLVGVSLVAETIGGASGSFAAAGAPRPALAQVEFPEEYEYDDFDEFAYEAASVGGGDALTQVALILFSVAVAAVFVTLSSVLFFRPEALGVDLREGESIVTKRWGRLEGFTSIFEVTAQVAVALYVLLFAVCAVAALGAILHLIGGLADTRMHFVMVGAYLEEILFFGGLVPLLGYVGYFFLHYVAQVVQVWVAIEANTSPPKGEEAKDEPR